MALNPNHIDAFYDTWQQTKEFLIVVLKISYNKEYLLVQEFIVLCSSFTIADTSLKPLLAAARQMHKYTSKKWCGCKWTLEDYSRNASCALNLISTFLLLSQGRYLCWWTIRPRVYHLPSGQCFGTVMVYYIWNLHFLNNVIINQTKILLPHAHVTLADFGYSV